VKTAPQDPLQKRIDTCRITTRLDEEETGRGDVSLSFDVFQTVLFRLNELIAQLE
jgi:hypothetical protein